MLQNASLRTFRNTRDQALERFELYILGLKVQDRIIEW